MFPKGINCNIIKVNQRSLGSQEVLIWQPPVYRAPTACRARWWRIHGSHLPQAHSPGVPFANRCTGECFMEKSLYRLQDWLSMGQRESYPTPLARNVFGLHQNWDDLKSSQGKKRGGGWRRKTTQLGEKDSEYSYKAFSKGKQMT